MHRIVQFVLRLIGRKMDSVPDTRLDTEVIHRPGFLHPPRWKPITIPVGKVHDFTGPLSLLQGRKVLAILDLENLSISAKKLGYRLNFRRLHDALFYHAMDLDAHAIFSRESGDERLVYALSRCGYEPHPRDIVHFPGGNRPCLANSDSRMLFETGRLTANHVADTLLLGTGDGELGDEIAQGVRSNFGLRWSVVTLSLAGSTSRRLSAVSNSAIHSNLAIGRDVLDELPRLSPVRHPHCSGLRRFIPTMKRAQNIQQRKFVK